MVFFDGLFKPWFKPANPGLQIRLQIVDHDGPRHQADGKHGVEGDGVAEQKLFIRNLIYRNVKTVKINISNYKL